MVILYALVDIIFGQFIYV